MRVRDVVKHRYVLGNVRQLLGELDRDVHRMYDGDPNRELTETERHELNLRLRILSWRLGHVADKIAPEPERPLMRSVPVNPQNPLGPRLLMSEPIGEGDMARLLNPIENAKAAAALHGTGMASAWVGSRFVRRPETIGAELARATAEAALTVDTYGRTFAITKEPGPPWWRLDRRLMNRWHSWRGIG